MSDETASGERIVAPGRHEGERLEAALRPTALDGFIGQRQVCENLEVFINAAKAGAKPWTTCFFTDRLGSARRRWPAS